MPTLHDAVDSTKKVLLYATIGIISMVIIYFLIQGGIALKNALFPTPVPPPTEDFGDLPDIVFPANATTQPLTYTVDTITGELPKEYPGRMLVYELIETEPTLLDLQNAKNKVRQIGFVTKEKEISDKVFAWTDLKTFSRTITMDIVSGNFYFSTDFIKNRTFLDSTSVLRIDNALKKGKEFFTSLSSFPSDIDEKLTKMQKFSIENGALIQTEVDTDTKVLRIDYFQKGMTDGEDDFPIYYAKPDSSPMNVLVTEISAQPVVEAHFTHHAISENTGEYYIKSPEQAFKELQNGEGYIAAYFGTDTEIKIHDVFLAYYLSEEKQVYMQPIWVFTNKTNGFHAYVPAIDDYWNNPPVTEEPSTK